MNIPDGAEPVSLNINSIPSGTTPSHLPCPVLPEKSTPKAVRGLPLVHDEARASFAPSCLTKPVASNTVRPGIAQSNADARKAIKRLSVLEKQLVPDRANGD